MRFLIFSDSKGKANGINKEILEKLLKESCRLIPKPDYIILGGDNIAGSKIQNDLVCQYEALRNLIRKYYSRIPLIPVIGNHEVNNEPIDDKYEKIFSRIYNDMLPNACLDDYNKTAFYVDLKDVRLIVLNSFHFNEIHKIAGKQLSWFKKAASADIKNKFVFVHSPAYPTGAHYGHCLDLYPKERNDFWKIVEDSNIDIIFSGHEHNYSRRIIESEKCVNQIITGGCGEKLRDKFKDKKGIVVAPIAKYHFVIVDVIENKIEVSAISSKGKLLDTFKIEKF